MKKYPEMHDFSHGQLIWGWTEFGIGVSICDGKYFWPDPMGYSKDEYDRWTTWVSANGYKIPEAYRDCYQIVNVSKNRH